MEPSQICLGGGIEHTRHIDNTAHSNNDNQPAQTVTQLPEAAAAASSNNIKPTTIVDIKSSNSSLPAAGVTTKPDGNPRERLGFKDREDRVRQLRDRQQQERLQKLEELKEHALAAQKFREQQETLRRHRLEELRARDTDRRSQVEERKRLIEQAERDRRESVLRKAQERENRLDHKRRQERSNAVFAFGSSTPRMLDPKENKVYWTQRRATSTSNVNVTDGIGLQIAGESTPREVANSDFARKRATSAHSLNRKGDELRMSTSMYEVFNWDEGGATSSVNQARTSQQAPSQGRQGEDIMTQSMSSSSSSAARRRTDLLPTVPTYRQTSARTPGGSPRHKSPGRAVSMGRLDTQSRTSSLAPVHEIPNERSTNAERKVSLSKRMKQSSAKDSLSKSMSHLGPQKKLKNIGSSTDGAGVPIDEGALDRRSSRSSLAISNGPQPRMTRGEILRRNKLKADAQKVAVSTANKALIGAPTATKSTRAKSATSSNNSTAPTTPSKSRPSTAKRTPAQVKADSAAKKAALAARIKSTPKATPIQSPSVPEKAIVSKDKETKNEKTTTIPAKTTEDLVLLSFEEKEVSKQIVEDVKVEAPPVEEKKVKEASPDIEIVKVIEGERDVSVQVEEKPNPVVDAVIAAPAKEDVVVAKDEVKEEVIQAVGESLSPAKQAQEKPVTGYATEEEYKVVLAEKRRQAREAKERELELERQKQLEEEERQRKEEEDYHRMIEEQKKAEEERLQKAIEEAEKQREIDEKKKQEDEILRIENERIEGEKKKEAEEKLKKEEEERQLRKSRVAAIMSRTRGASKSKTEAKTPSEDKTFATDPMVSSTLADAIASAMTGSMTDSMIVKAIESHEHETTGNGDMEKTDQEQPQSLATSGVSSKGSSDLSSQPPSVEFCSQASGNFQATSDFQSDSSLDTSIQSVKVTESTNFQSDSKQDTSVQSIKVTENSVDNLIDAESVRKTETVPMDNLLGEDVTVELASLRLDNPLVHMNGNGSVNGTQSVDLLESFNTLTLNGGIHRADDLINSSSTIPVEDEFDQIIDLSQTKLSNEDAVNSNTFPSPIIAFEENINLNRKSSTTSQSQESSPTVPDLLL